MTDGAIASDIESSPPRRRVRLTNDSRRSPGGSGSRAKVRPLGPGPEDQCEQPFGAPPSSAVRKLDPQPQAATALGLLTVKPAPISVST